ncbi:MAG: glutamate--tRNA ligase [Erysipelothrix sp.]|nr:glutamate--tRNA ligase [Erysipelothrix sp.]
MTKVRVRYAPSPTGHLHIGNARTALFNYLFAKHYNGDFILRIEDTDLERNVVGGEESQMKYLHWLGITPDESPIQPNPKYAPYRQMERLDMYQKYAQQLIDAGHAYKCYCTEEELEEDYEAQKANGVVATQYNRKCLLHRSKEELESLAVTNTPFTIRVRVPENETYTFNDMIRGEVSFESKDIGDWVLIKANGIPTYNFAVVIDDHTMDITHVFRGEEHLSNTPKQMMIYRMLGWDTPSFGHMTLIVNEQRKKLSKRDNSILQFMSQYEELGYLPEAMFNFMSLLGWSPVGEEEIFTHQQLIEQFSEERLSKSPSMFDPIKLKWINNRYIKALSFEDFKTLTLPFLEKQYDLTQISQEWIDTLLHLFQEQCSYGQEIVSLTAMFFEDHFSLENEEAETMFNLESTQLVAHAFAQHRPAVWSVETVKETINKVKEVTGLKGKPLFMGLRVVASGKVHGPDLASTLYLLGEERVISACLAR